MASPGQDGPCQLLLAVLRRNKNVTASRPAGFVPPSCSPPASVRRRSPASLASGWWSSGCRPTPELNPVEGLWANLKGKGGELANLTSPTLAGVIAQAHRGIDRVRETPHLAYSFLRRSGLPVW